MVPSIIDVWGYDKEFCSSSLFDLPQFFHFSHYPRISNTFLPPENVNAVKF